MRYFAWAFTLIIVLVSLITQANQDKGTQWLSEQQISGVFYSNKQFADSIQVTAEAVSLLSSSPSAVFDKAAANAFVIENRQSHTEALYWKILIKALSGIASNPEIEQLRTHQNQDGGFGSYQGYDSNPLDSAFALKSFLLAESSNSAVISKTLSYLLQQQDSNGAFKLNNSNDDSIYVTALVLNTLSDLKFNFQISAEIDRATQYLVVRLNDKNTNLVAWQQAIAIIAIRLSTVDSTNYKTASDLLLNQQLENGSWDDDSYTTALMLKSAKEVSVVQPPTSVIEASISGRVIERSQYNGIGGATIQLTSRLDGAINYSINANGQGLFELKTIPQGDYYLTISAIGYLTVSSDITLRSGKNLELGNISLQSLPNQGVIKGVVLSAEDSMPLQDAIITVTGNTSAVVSTDATGQYQLSVEPGLINIGVSLDGYQSASATATILAGNVSVFSPSLYLDGTEKPLETKLTGRILDFSTLQPIQFARIKLDDIYEAQSNIDGEFEILNVPSGEVNIEIEADGYDASVYRATLQENAINSLGDLTLRLTQSNVFSTVMGIVLDDVDQSPIDGAEVNIPELGLSTRTGDDGRYEINGISVNDFSVDINAVGYFGASNQASIELGSILVANASLYRAAANGIEINELRIPTGEVYESYSEVELEVGFLNTSETVTPIRLYLKVVNSVGEVVEQYPIVSVPMGGSISDAYLSLQPGVQTEAEVEWHITDQWAGAYNLIVQAYSETGQLLVERGKQIEISATSRLGGYASFTPPISQLAENNPIKITATIANRGNTNLKAQQLTATIKLKNKGFGAEVVDSSIAKFIDGNDIKNIKASGVDGDGNFYYLNDSGRELKRRNVDGSIDIIATGFSNVGKDIDIDENKVIRILTDRSIIKINTAGEQAVIMLDFSSALKFTYLGDDKYYIWNNSGLYEFTEGSASKKVISKGLAYAQSVIKTNDGNILIADYSGDVFKYSNGELKLYNHYNKNLIKIFAYNGERIIGLDSTRKNIYELMPDGSLSIIADGFSSLYDLDQLGESLVVVDHSENAIIKVELNGNKTVLAGATYTGITALVERSGELFGIRNDNQLVKVNNDKSVEFLSNIQRGSLDLIAKSDGTLVEATLYNLYQVEEDGSYTAINYDGRIIGNIDADNSNNIFVDNNGNFPIKKVNTSSVDIYIDNSFYNPTTFSKIPDQDSILILSSNRNVVKVNKDLSYALLTRLPFTAYSSLLAINDNEFIAGDYSSKRLVRFNGDGTNEILVDLEIRPRYLSQDANGNVYIAEYYGNRIYKWNETDGLTLYRTLASPVYYGFTVSDQGVIYYGRSNGYIFKSDVTEEQFSKAYSTVFDLTWENGSIIATSRGNIQKIDQNGSVVTLANSGSISSESYIAAYPIANNQFIAATGSGEVIIYDESFNELIVGQGLNGIRDFDVRSNGTYVLDASGRVGYFETPNKLAKLLYTNSSYQKLSMITDDEGLLFNTTGVDKIDFSTGVKNQLLTSINGMSVHAVRGDRVVVYDKSTSEVAVAKLDGEVLERYFDINTPKFIAVDSANDLYVMQNSSLVYRNIYKLNSNKKLSKAASDNYSSPISFRHVESGFVIARSNYIYSGDTIDTIGLSWTRKSGEESYIDVIDSDSNSLNAITRYDYVEGNSTGQNYYGFNLSIVNDIDVLDSGRVLFSAKTRLLELVDGDYIRAFPMKFSNLKSIEELELGKLTLFDTNGYYENFDLNTPVLNTINYTEIIGTNISFDHLHRFENGYILQGSSSVSLQTSALLPDNILVGDTVFQGTINYPGTLKGSPSLELFFGEWLPTESGDYEVLISSSDSSVDGYIMNQIHVGPLAQASIAPNNFEILPGSQTVDGVIRITGADSSAITTIDPDATSLAASSFTSGRAIAADSFGNIYAGSSSLIKIITPSGEISDFVTGSLGIRNGMAIDDENNIYAGTYNGILKVSQAKEISFNQVLGAVTAVAVDTNNNLYAANNTGVYILKDHETPELIASAGLSNPQAIAVDAYGTIYVLNSGNRISQISNEGAVSDYYKDATFEYEGVNLVADCSRNLIFAPTYDPVGKPRSGEEDRLVQLMADTKESRLVLDGSLYDYAMRDIDVLYYDRFGDRFLIWTDLNSGKIFSFPVICGGIDVELHATTRADVEINFANLPADEVSDNNGVKQLKWNLKDVDVSGVDLAVQFVMQNMKEGEKRAVLDSAFLRFKNTFDDQNPIDLPLEIPSILAITRVDLEAQTDQQKYLPNSDVNISVNFLNASAGPLSGVIEYGIYDQNNNAVVNFPVRTLQDQSPSDLYRIEQLWNAQDTLADTYILKATFKNSRGELVENIEYPFNIVSDTSDAILAFNSHISTDKTLYNKGENALIAIQILNVSENVISENLQAQVRLLDINDNQIFSISRPVQALYPNGIYNNQINFMLSTVAAGQYRAQLLVMDVSSNQTMQTSEYQFSVNQGGLGGSGLTAAANVTPDKINKGLPFTCGYDVKNIGDVKTADTQFKLLLVSAETETVISENNITRIIESNQSEILANQYQSQDLAVGGYVCALQANVQGQWQTLASHGLLVREDPILSLLDASVVAANEQVYLGEPTSCLDTVQYNATSGSSNVDIIQRLMLGDTIVEEDIQANKELQAGVQEIYSRNYDAAALSLGEYSCELLAQRNGTLKLLASDTFTVVEPPVKVSAELIPGTTGRLLVLTDASRQCSALEDIHVKVNWGSELANNSSVTIRIYDKDNNLIDTEIVSAWDVEINSQQPLDHTDASILVNTTGDIHLFLSSAEHKLGDEYRFEVEVKKGWLFKNSKSWKIETDCDRPLTIGEVIEDIHLLGFKLFTDNSESIKDLDPYGPAEAPTVTEQNDFIQHVLDAQGWTYSLVHDANTFTQQMRHGDYSAYIILSERAHLSVLAQKELREHVYAGKGLLVAGSHDNRNLFTQAALGIMSIGKHKSAIGVTSKEASPSFSFPYPDFVQNVQLLGASVEMEYEFDDGKNAKSIKDMKRRAVTSNEFGNGRSIFMGFDVLAMSTRQGASTEITQLLVDSIARVQAPIQNPIAMREFPVNVHILNTGVSVFGQAVITLPQGAEMANSSGFVQQGNVWVKPFTLHVGEQLQQNIYVKLPAQSGLHTINLYVEAEGMNGGTANVEAQLNIDVSDTPNIESLIEQAVEIKHAHWYEPHFYVIYGDLLLVQHAIEHENWNKAQLLLVGASNLLLLDNRTDVSELRSAIANQVRIIGQHL